MMIGTMVAPVAESRWWRQRQRAGGGTEEKKIAGEGLGKWWNGGGRKREKGREV